MGLKQGSGSARASTDPLSERAMSNMPPFPSPSAENLFGPSAYMPVESTYQVPAALAACVCADGDFRFSSGLEVVA